MANIIGASRSSVLPVGSTLRLTWASPTFGLDSLFSWYFNEAVNKVPAVARIQPLSLGGASTGDTAATVDFVNHAERAVGDIANDVATLDGNFVQLQTVEVLSGAAKAAATARSDTAAVARDNATNAAESAASSGSVLGKIGDTAKSIFDKLQMAGVAVVIIVVIVGFVYLRGSRK